MNYEKLEYYISSRRLERYYNACKYSKTNTKKLYSINMKLSQAFYPILSMLEIFLRNSIDNTLTVHFSDHNWIISQKTEFMSNSSLAPRYILRESIDSAESKIKRRDDKITSGKIIAEQSLGFWISLFYKNHYRLLKGVIIKCFPFKESYVNRNDIFQSLDRIRKFRNRVYHNESICFDNRLISFKYPELIRNEIYKVIAWMNPDLVQYLKEFDKTDHYIKVGESLRTKMLENQNKIGK